jgi:transposase-like protein
MPLVSGPVEPARTGKLVSQAAQDKKHEQSNAANSFYTVADFNREFPDDDACLEYVKDLRWPNGVTHCKKCDTERKHHRVTGRTAYACNRCGNHMYPLKGTVFSGSTTSLKTWFYVMYLMASTGGGISAKRIQRETGVTYKTAWRMMRQLQHMVDKKQKEPADRTIEIAASNAFRIRPNGGLAATQEPESALLPPLFDQACIGMSR